ncbi:MAG: hypothetical protein U1F14_08890 [Steroidobacteraceae bacterium]
MSRTLNPMLIAAVLLCGCVVQETKPQPILHAEQATTQVPEAELLDVGVRLFDANVPKAVLDDPGLADKVRVYPDIRKAEARYLPNQLRSTLEGTGQWGAVRVIPATVDTMDVVVTGRIVESSGTALALDIGVEDATGRKWFEKRYEAVADTRSYKEGPGRERDPFQNLYVKVADDMLAARRQLKADDLKSIHRVTGLRFAADFAPAAMSDYLAKDAKKGTYTVQRLPSESDPVVARLERIRERDDALIDTVSDGYAAFGEKIAEPYNGWRASTYNELEAEERAKSQSASRIAIGAALVAAAIFMPVDCKSATCERAETVGRVSAAYGGVQAVMSGIKKRDEAKMHTEALKEISGSFQDQAEPAVVDIEGRTLRLTGTAEEQYAEWRRLLHQEYVEETGGTAATGPAPAGSTPAGASPADVQPPPAAQPAPAANPGAANASS